MSELRTKRPLALRLGVFVVASAALFVGACLADRWVWRQVDYLVKQHQPAIEIQAYTPQPGPLPTVPKPSISGDITQLHEGGITVQTGDGRSTVVLLNDKTAVRVDGKAVKAADLRTGMTAFAYVKTDWIAGTDWRNMLRMNGYLPTWLLVAAALLLARWPKRRQVGAAQVVMPPLLLVVAAVVSGALTEIIKFLVRRERPNLHDGEHVFRAWSSDFWSNWDTSGIGLPSSHAVVAFGAAFMLMRLYPRAWPVWLFLAIGCGATRVLEQAHFLSDVTLAAIVGYAVAWSLVSFAAQEKSPA